MARRQVPRFVQRKRSLTDWARGLSISPQNVNPATKILLSTIVNTNAGITETIRRTRGLCAVKSDQNAAVEEQTGAYGMVIVTDLAAAAGAASIPGPFTDRNDDGWFLWVPFTQFTSGSVAGGYTSMQYQFDSKAMRKLEQGFSIAVMVENASAGDAFSFMHAFSLLASRT